MTTVSILALERALLASVADSRSVFTMVNEFLQQSGKPALFTIQLVGISKEVKLNDGLFYMHPNVILKDVKQTDLIIIPAMSGDMTTATFLNKEYATWIAQQYKNGAEVASLCAGAFLFAFSGLLKGKPCTTHWLYANEFRTTYPDVKLVDEKVITDQNGLYSSGGNISYWNLLIYLIEKYTGREMAIRAAKYFAIDLNRTIQSPFMMFNSPRDHKDDMIEKAQDYIGQHYERKMTVDEIAETFKVSRRTLERRFKKATYYTVVEYIQRIKMEAAKKQLEIGRKTVQEVMSSVGYTDTNAFREVFKKITGLSPVDYRNKYNNGNR